MFDGKFTQIYVKELSWLSRVKSSNKANKKSIFKTFKENKELLFLTIPGTLWFLVFAYLPMFGIVLAFKNLENSTGVF